MSTMVMMAMEEFPEEHRVGDPACDVGWCGGVVDAYPRACLTCGEGLVHATFGDESASGDYWLDERCDHCGSDHPKTALPSPIW